VLQRYVERAGLKVVGSCHLFRHPMATHMLENGADIRYIQAILGHHDLDTTAIYTHVSIHKLKAVHATTHPAKLHRVEPPSDSSAAEQHDSEAVGEPELLAAKTPHPPGRGLQAGTKT
jgi:integrase/recombinase XerD